jgi:hypothetical protein
MVVSENYTEGHRVIDTFKLASCFVSMFLFMKTLRQFLLLELINEPKQANGLLMTKKRTNS